MVFHVPKTVVFPIAYPVTVIQKSVTNVLEDISSVVIYALFNAQFKVVLLATLQAFVLLVQEWEWSLALMVFHVLHASVRSDAQVAIQIMSAQHALLA
jgi:hypothetical protein